MKQNRRDVKNVRLNVGILGKILWIQLKNPAPNESLRKGDQSGLGERPIMRCHLDIILIITVLLKNYPGLGSTLFLSHWW